MGFVTKFASFKEALGIDDNCASETNISSFFHMCVCVCFGHSTDSEHLDCTLVDRHTCWLQKLRHFGF